MAGEGADQRRNLLIVGGVLVLHAVVLASLVSRRIEPGEASAPLVLDVTLERPRLSPARPDGVAPAVAPGAPPGPRASRPTAPPEPAMVPTETPPAAPVLEDRWRVQPNFVRPGAVPAPRRIAGDCLDLLEDRPLCRAQGAPPRPIEAELPDETPAVARVRARDRRRDDGFERQVRANEAWRDYTRGEGAYPGLRSLFSER